MNAARCSNSPLRDGYRSRCDREATGEDGLCNRCRSAKARGDALRAASRERFSLRERFRNETETSIRILPSEANARVDIGTRTYQVDRVSVDREWLLDLYRRATEAQVGR